MERRGEFADSEVASRIDSRIMTHSCSQLLQRVDCLVRVLRSPGIKPGDRAGTLASNLPRAPLLTTGTDAVGTVAFHPGPDGWSLLRNGVVVSDDMGEIPPEGRRVAALKYGSLAWGHS
jgi:hypothetical protein